MNAERDDERALEDYLGGETELSRLYRESAREQPSAELDARVLARARRGAAPYPAPRVGPFATRWALPLSLAAVVVLSVSLVLLVQEPDLVPPPPGGEAKTRPAAAPEADDAESRSAAGAAGGEKARREGAASGVAAPRQSEGEAPGRHAPETLVAPPPAADVLEPAAPRDERPAEQRRRLDADRAPPAAADAPAFRAPASGDAPEAVRADPQAWLRFIEALAARGDEALARRELGAFRARYPAHPLPPPLRELSESRSP